VTSDIKIFSCQRQTFVLNERSVYESANNRVNQRANSQSLSRFNNKITLIIKVSNYNEIMQVCGPFYTTKSII